VEDERLATPLLGLHIPSKDAADRGLDKAGAVFIVFSSPPPYDHGSKTLRSESEPKASEELARISRVRFILTGAL